MSIRVLFIYITNKLSEKILLYDSLVPTLNNSFLFSCYKPDICMFFQVFQNLYKNIFCIFSYLYVHVNVWLYQSFLTEFNDLMHSFQNQH